jgi:alpha-tubulin suppressor-like RCC1 family protein
LKNYLFPFPVVILKNIEYSNLIYSKYFVITNDNDIYNWGNFGSKTIKTPDKIQNVYNTTDYNDWIGISCGIKHCLAFSKNG